MIDLSKLELGRFVNTTRIVKGTKESVVDWLNQEIKTLESRGNLKLKDTKNTNGLYERRGWSRVSKDGGNKVKIRIEVRGRNVYFTEEDCLGNNSILVKNDYNVVLETLKYLLKEVKKESDKMKVYCMKGKGSDRKMISM